MIKSELQKHIDAMLITVADVIPELVGSDPASFKCGHAMGYKQALLDIDRVFLQEERK